MRKYKNVLVNRQSDIGNFAMVPLPSTAIAKI